MAWIEAGGEVKKHGGEVLVVLKKAPNQKNKHRNKEAFKQEKHTPKRRTILYPGYLIRLKQSHLLKQLQGIASLQIFQKLLKSRKTKRRPVCPANLFGIPRENRGETTRTPTDILEMQADLTTIFRTNDRK